MRLLAAALPQQQKAGLRRRRSVAHPQAARRSHQDRPARCAQLRPLLRAGTLTPVHIPTPDQEAFRDVVRAWQQAKRDITSARQRLKAFLLRNDIRYTGQAKWSAFQK